MRLVMEFVDPCFDLFIPTPWSQTTFGEGRESILERRGSGAPEPEATSLRHGNAAMMRKAVLLWLVLDFGVFGSLKVHVGLSAESGLQSPNPKNPKPKNLRVYEPRILSSASHVGLKACWFRAWDARIIPAANRSRR